MYLMDSVDSSVVGADSGGRTADRPRRLVAALTVTSRCPTVGIESLRRSPSKGVRAHFAAAVMAHRVDSLRCEGSDAIGAKRTCQERRKRVDLTKMTHQRHRLCTAAMVLQPISAPIKVLV
jgi:hypothetical protein